MRNTINTFGIRFFLYYGLLYAIRKLFNVGNEKILQNNSIKVVQLHESVNSPRSRSVIAECEPDLILSILGNEVFKKDILTEYRILNLHTGLLPKYRGLMPTFWAMLNEEKEIGVSVFFVDEGIDSGPIIVQKLVPIEGLTQKQVIDKTKVVGVMAICEAVEKLMTGSYELFDNKDEDSTYFKFPKRSDVEKFRKIGARFF